MANQRVEDEEITDVINEIEESGVNPTVAAIQERIGGGGSARIARILKDWRITKRNRQLEPFAMPSLGADVRATAEKAFKKIYEIAAAEANADYKLAKKVWAEDMEEATDRIADLEKQLTDTEVALESCKESLKASELKLDGVASKLAEQQGEAARSNAEAEVARKELGKLTEQLALANEEHRAQITTLKTQHESAVAELQERHSQALAATQTDLAAAQGELKVALSSAHQAKEIAAEEKYDLLAKLTRLEARIKAQKPSSRKRFTTNKKRNRPASE